MLHYGLLPVNIPENNSIIVKKVNKKPLEIELYKQFNNETEIISENKSDIQTNHNNSNNNNDNTWFNDIKSLLKEYPSWKMNESNDDDTIIILNNKNDVKLTIKCNDNDGIISIIISDNTNNIKNITKSDLESILNNPKECFIK